RRAAAGAAGAPGHGRHRSLAGRRRARRVRPPRGRRAPRLQERRPAHRPRARTCPRRRGRAIRRGVRPLRGLGLPDSTRGSRADRARREGDRRLPRSHGHKRDRHGALGIAEFRRGAAPAVREARRPDGAGPGGRLRGRGDRGGGSRPRAREVPPRRARVAPERVRRRVRAPRGPRSRGRGRPRGGAARPSGVGDARAGARRPERGARLRPEGEGGDARAHLPLAHVASPLALVEAQGEAEVVTGDVRCDLVIPVYDALRATKPSVESVARNAPPWRRVGVGNDAGGPETTAFLRSWPGLVLLENERNLGFVKSANRGLLHSDAPWVCLLNSDTLLTKGALERMVAGC